MTDINLLEEKIQQSGKKKGYLAAKLGMTLATFRKYCINIYEFRASHIDILCDELGIDTLEERDAIFFAKHDALKTSKQ